jgi:orotidine-5'-phosphate decarboxylase
MTKPAHFADRLFDAVERCGNPCVVGIDPHLDLLPDEFAAARDPKFPRAQRAQVLERFCCELLDVVGARVPAVKPQSAFFEAFGADGVRAWERVVAHAHRVGALVIGDVKRGDIASTAAAYATAFLEGTSSAEREMLCDAVTLNPFLGADSIEPFVRACTHTGAGIFVLVRTSNPGSADFQRHGSPELSFAIAQRVRSVGEALVGQRGWSSVGAVVGATHAAELRAFRDAMPRTPFLLPGFGAQGARAQDVVGAFERGAHATPLGALVNSSRGIAFAHRDAAHRDKPWRRATSDALDQMIHELRSALQAAH